MRRLIWKSRVLNDAKPLMRCNLAGRVGTCASAAASAPTLTPWGLMLAAFLLTSVAAFALRYRMRSR
jgi:hypothetical protein